MKSIFLIGFMGSGKSSVAQHLANRLNFQLKDMDSIIESEYNTKISAIFEREGEATFRNYETALLKKLPVENAIISTGGGVVEREENIVWMKEHGLVVYLETSWKEIVTRLKNDTLRPLWNQKGNDKKELYNSRLMKYSEVSLHTVRTDRRLPEDIASEIYRLVQQKY
ncbi:AAA family ATPase [Aquibacillus halophilus]|uniref:Shikimate kinase n=1 Tax=Aquibacillus halophilus TaxID=930132 RepID=A0A6A8DHF7_9BACI|nr:AAA family ATPase [Aquibacillus halophilus]